MRSAVSWHFPLQSKWVFSAPVSLKWTGRMPCPIICKNNVHSNYQNHPFFIGLAKEQFKNKGIIPGIRKLTSTIKLLSIMRATVVVV